MVFLYSKTHRRMFAYVFFLFRYVKPPNERALEIDGFPYYLESKYVKCYICIYVYIYGYGHTNTIQVVLARLCPPSTNEARLWKW